MTESLKQDFDDNLSCPVCLENFVGDHVPKDLDCPHLCCLVCLNEMPSDIIGGLKCPQCQRITTIPDGGVSGLRTNLLARNLAETLSNHKKAQVGRNAKLCIYHDNQEILFFCSSCKHSICQYCIIQKHSNHKFEPIESLVKSQKLKIGRALQKAKVHIEICQRIDVKVTNNEEMLKTKFKKAEASIEKRIQDCVNEINAEGEYLKKKLNELKASTLAIVQKQKENNQSGLQKKRDVVDETQTCLDQASDSEYLVVHDKLFGKLKLLIEDNTSKVESISTESGFKLEIGKWNVDLGLNLIPEQITGGGDHDVPSTSTMSPPQGDRGAGCSSYKSSGSGDGNQEPTSSSKKRKRDDEAEADVLCLSDEEKPKPDFYDLTTGEDV